MENIRGLVVLCALILMLASSRAQNFDVTTFGAVGDGTTDDSGAFGKAWAATCGASGSPTLQIPQGKTFLLKPINFLGPCKASTVHVQIQGTIVAPKDMSAWAGAPKPDEWLTFSDVNGLTVDGTGTIDGQGSAWWQACKPERPLLTSNNCERPTALKFAGCNNLQMSGLTHLNSQRNHISIAGCDTAVLSNLHITAPETSPNTDGIDISNSKNIQILNSNIATGDDCIAINTGSSFINITQVTCGPGHGISVGSLGKGGESAAVEEVHVKGCTFINTQNGARIKTWQGGSGYAKTISFENITLQGARNPIIIDQFYDAAAINNGPGVQVSGVTYTGFQGTSSSSAAITLTCDQIGCTGLTLQHITITVAGGGAASASCSNAHGTATDCTPSVPCLLG